MQIKGLLIDLDGTLYVGGEPVEGTKEALARLETVGIRYLYITNTTRKPAGEVAAGLDEMGFPSDRGLIFTPAVAAAGMLADRRCYPLVPQELLEDLGSVEVVGDPPSDFVAVGDMGEEFGYGRLDVAFRHLMDGADLIALQKNRYWQKEDGLHLDAGPFVAALEYASGKRATVVGKPETEFFEAALAKLGLEADEVAMVGDDPESDVQGAQLSGIKGVQVKTGKYRLGAYEGEPDLLLDSFAGLPEALGV
jgi:HAD superfamily hydrolase (TIGR01458 family)